MWTMLIIFLTLTNEKLPISSGVVELCVELLKKYQEEEDGVIHRFETKLKAKDSEQTSYEGLSGIGLLHVVSNHLDTGKTRIVL